MKFSVIIVNYASWPLTLRCIESLQQTRYGDFEVFVVDNDSAEVPELPSWVRLIRNKENVGFARAHNRGIAASSGDPVVLINPDTIVEKDFFEHLEAFVAENPKAGISGPRIVDSEGGPAPPTSSRASGWSPQSAQAPSPEPPHKPRLSPKSSIVKSQFPAVT